MFSPELYGSGYRGWVEDEIVRIEALVTRTLLSRDELLLLNQSTEVADALAQNEKRLRHLDVALMALWSAANVAGQNAPPEETELRPPSVAPRNP